MSHEPTGPAAAPRTRGAPVGAGGGALGLAIAAGLFGQGVVSAIALTPPVLAPAAAPAFGLSPSDVGLFTTVVFLAATLSAASGGSLVTRFGAVRTSQGCILLGAVGLATLVTASPAVAVLGALLVGIGYGPLTPASSHLLAALTTARNRPLVFSTKQTSIPLGGAVAGFLPPLIASRLGWQAAILAICGIAVAVALALQPIRARFDRDRDPHAPLSIHVLGPAREALAHPGLRRIVITSFSFAAVQGAFNAFFVTFLVETAALGLVAAGILLMLGQVVAIVARIVWGALAERVLPSRLLLAGIGTIMSASALASAFVTADWPTPALFVLSALFGISAVGWNGLYLAEIVRVTSAAASARATGGTLVFTFSGMMTMPAVFTLVIAATDSYRLAFALLALVPVAAVVAMLTWRESGAP